MNGLACGNGRAVAQNGYTFESRFYNGLPEGFGVETRGDGRRIEGEFKFGEKFGKHEIPILRGPPQLVKRFKKL